MATRRVVMFNPRDFPKTVEVLGKVYSVKVVPKLDGGVSDGEFVPEEDAIYIARTNKTLSNALDTLIHEIMHVAEYSVGIDFNESWVRPVATAVTRALVQNKKIIDLIIKVQQQEGEASGKQTPGRPATRTRGKGDAA